MNRKNLVLALIALLLVIVVNWLTEEGVKRVEQRQAIVSPAQQDYYLTDTTITVFNQQGQPQHQIQAQQLGHNEQEQNTTIVQPQLQVFSQGKLQWHVSAASGRLDQKRDEFLLEGGVTMEQSGSYAPLRLTTPSLRVQPQQGMASTDQAVTLQHASNRIDAIGMRLEEQGKRLQLLSNVRAKYATQTP